MDQLVGELKRIQDEDMERFLFDALRHIEGSRIEMIEPHIYKVRPGLYNKYYAVEEPAFVGTTFRRLAVERPEIDFFTKDHPMFKALLEKFRLPDTLAVSCQIQRGEEPSIILGVEI